MIKRLPTELINQIKTNSEISDLNECIIQLVNNSLDAQADYIFIQIDFMRLNILMCDNGIGMSNDDLDLIGECNVTSKLTSFQSIETLETFGFHGHALFNIIQQSDALEIITRQKLSGSQLYNLKKLSPTHSSPIKCLGMYENCFRHDLNTFILIEGLFRTNTLRFSQVKIFAKQIEALLHELKVLSVMFYNVEIIIEDAHSGKCLFNSIKTDCFEDQFKRIVGSDLANSFKLFDYKDGVFCFKGLINFSSSKESLSSSEFQLIYVNRRSLDSKELCQMVAKQLSSCRQFNILNVDQSNMIFCISVTCPVDEYTIVYRKKKFVPKFGSNKFKETIERFIDSLLVNFEFKRQNLLHHPVLKCNDQKHFSKVIKYGRNINTENLKYTRLSKQIKRLSKKKDLKINKLTYSGIKLKLFGNLEKLSKKRLNLKNKSVQVDIADLPTEKKVVLKENWAEASNDKGVKFYINLIDGYTTYDIREALFVGAHKSFSSFNRFSGCDLLEDIKPRCKEERQFRHGCQECEVGEDRLNMNKVLIEKSVLVKWRNKEEFYGNSADPALNNYDRDNFDTIGSKIIDRNVFKNLNVIGQMDRKFIVCHSQTAQNLNTLFIFDQHGCHERIRLESIYKENFKKSGVLESEELPESWYFKINKVTSDEVFNVFTTKMQTLGFEVDYDKVNNKLRIFTLPKIIFKKLGIDESLKEIVRNLIISQLKECNSVSKSTCTSRPTNSGFSLLHVPTEIIDLFNMDACRGAIKFGDELSKQHCQEIINDLAKCQLPFQCAHGRPTVLPLTNLVMASGRNKNHKLNLCSLRVEE